MNTLISYCISSIIFQKQSKHKNIHIMSWLGIIAFVCLGAFIGIVINSASKAKGKLLQQNFVELGNLVGLTMDEIKSKVGEPSAMQSCVVQATGNPGMLYTWSKLPYSITLLFDENNKCLGVNKEISA